VKGSGQRNPYHQGYDVNPIDIAYSSSHEDFYEKGKRAIRRRHPRDDSRDLQFEAPEFNDNLNP